MSADKYNFNIKLQAGKYTVEIDTDKDYGYFEHDELGDGAAGGLWFEGPVLVDYDGMSCLPRVIVTTLREHGFVLDETFD